MCNLRLAVHVEKAGCHHDVWLLRLGDELPPQFVSTQDDRLVGAADIGGDFCLSGIAVRSALCMGNRKAFQAQHPEALFGQMVASGRADSAHTDHDNIERFWHAIAAGAAKRTEESNDFFTPCRSSFASRQG